MPFAAHVHWEILVRRAWVAGQKAVIARSDVGVSDFDHQRLAGGASFVDA